MVYLHKLFKLFLLSTLHLNTISSINISISINTSSISSREGVANTVGKEEETDLDMIVQR